MNTKLVEAVKLLTINLARERAKVATRQQRFKALTAKTELTQDEEDDLYWRLIEKENFVAGYSAALRAVRELLSPEELTSLSQSPTPKQNRFYYSAQQASLDPEHIVAVTTPEGEEIVYSEWCRYPDSKCNWPDAVLVYAADDIPVVRCILETHTGRGVK